jgi:hypothetical protein
MNELVKRLRRLGVLDPLRLEAADAIDRLIKQNTELLTVLTKIADDNLSDKSAATLARSAVATIKLLAHDP